MNTRRSERSARDKEKGRESALLANAVVESSKSSQKDLIKTHHLIPDNLWTWGCQHKRLAPSRLLDYNPEEEASKRPSSSLDVDLHYTTFTEEATKGEERPIIRFYRRGIGSGKVKNPHRQNRLDELTERFEVEWSRLGLDQVEDPIELAERIKLMTVEGIDRPRIGRQAWKKVRLNRDFNFQIAFKKQQSRINKTSRRHQEYYSKGSFDWQMVFKDARKMENRNSVHNRDKIRVGAWKAEKKMIIVDNLVEEAFEKYVLEKGYKDYKRMNLEELAEIILDFTVPNMTNLQSFKHLYGLLEMNTNISQAEVNFIKERKMRYNETKRSAKYRSKQASKAMSRSK